MHITFPLNALINSVLRGWLLVVMLYVPDLILFLICSVSLFPAVSARGGCSSRNGKHARNKQRREYPLTILHKNPIFISQKTIFNNNMSGNNEILIQWYTSKWEEFQEGMLYTGTYLNRCQLPIQLNAFSDSPANSTGAWGVQGGAGHPESGFLQFCLWWAGLLI